MRMFSFLALLPLLTSFLSFSPLLTSAKAVTRATSSSSCVGTISSLSDVSAAVKCTTVNINAFTVPAGQTFSLDLLQGTTVNVLGDIQFGTLSWAGPLFEIKGQDITFNGNNKVWHGDGQSYWDGLGGKGSLKPSPMMHIGISGTLTDVHVINSPQNCFAINNDGPLVVSGVIVNNRKGNYPNAESNGLPAGRNTDGFDVSGDDLVIKNSIVINQDDCLAINQGQNIVFEDNYCDSGHGISIGSISSNAVVEGVVIRGNQVVNSVQAFRIKTDRVATNSRVTNVTYSGNTSKNCTEYGVLITQSYPDTLGTPGNGVIISDISFDGQTTEVLVGSDAKAVAVNCGEGSCTGSWDWSGLEASGGKAGLMMNSPGLTGYTQ